MPELRLSVVDQSPISEGSTGADALHNTLDLARLADDLGYHRYWVAEHHGTPMLACASPEVLIGPIAAATERIRVGSGGVMLPHYSPLAVAENFSILSGLYPGPHRPRHRPGAGHRPADDAGPPARPPPPRAGRLPRTAHRAARLPRGPHAAPTTPSPASRRCPAGRETPEVWLLGSSPQSAIWAAELGLPYCFADFINPTGAEIVADYRRRFVDSERLSAPLVAVASSAVAAETDEEAERLASSGRMAFSLLRQGRLIKVPPVEQALSFLASRPPNSAAPRRRAVIGSPETVRKGLNEVVAEYGAEELFVVTITHGHQERRRSYELIAEAMELSPTPAAAASSRG